MAGHSLEASTGRVDDRVLPVQAIGEKKLRRLDIAASKDHIHVVFGTAVEDPAVGVGSGQGLKIGLERQPTQVCMHH
ncbi:MAG: hypothetical protein AABZ15_15550 [Nitrospirota bacterium]